MTLVLFIPGSPAPGANLPILPLPYKTLISDTFTGGDTLDINGRTTDSGLGGTSATWVSSPANSFAISSGKLVRGSASSGTSGAALNVGNNAIRMTIAINALPSTNAFFDLRKGTPDGGGAVSNGYRLRVTSTGVVEVQKKVGSPSASVISVGSHTITSGSTVGLQVVNNELTLFINGSAQETIIDSSPLTGSYFEIYQGATATLSLSSVLFESIG